MRTHRITFALSPVFVLAALGACSSSPSPTPTLEGPNEGTPPGSGTSEPSPSATASALTPKRWSPSSELLLPVVKACAELPDAYVDGDGRCACPKDASGNLQVFTTRTGVAACVAPERLPEYMASCLAQDGAAPRVESLADRSRWNACLQELAHVTDDTGQTTFALSLPATSTASADQQLARDAIAWAKTRFSTPGKAQILLWNEGLVDDSLKLHVGTPPAVDLAAAVRDLLSPVFTGAGLPWMFRTHAFGSTVANFDALLGEPIAEEQRMRAMTPPPPRGDAVLTALYSAYTAAFREASVDLSPTRGREFGLAGRGCAGHCFLESSPAALPDGLTVRLERVYLWGSVAREVLWVSSSERTLGAVVVGASTVPFAYLAFDPRQTSEEMALSVRVYDHSWNLAGEARFATSAPFAARATAARFDPSATRVPTVALCEGQGKELLLAPDLAPHVLMGPHAAEAAGGAGSFLGWVANPGADPTRGMLGVADFDFGAVPIRPGFYITAGHAEAAARAVLSVEPTARLVTLGTDACLSRFDDWAGPLTTCDGAPCGAPAARVVSISFASTGLSNACATGFGALFTETKERLLWVAAAGNGGVGFGRNGTEVPAGLCPSMQGGSAPNLLVVAAATEAGLESYSNFGATKVDLAAPGDSTGDGQPFEGTSFATPRVAAVGARILNDFPSLTPGDVRTILMAAGRPVPSLRGVVRSGALLDPTASLATARCIAAKGIAATRTPLAACLREASYAGDIDDKLALLAGRGVAL